MYILYDNIFAKTTAAGYALSSSTAATGYDAANVADWNDWDFWKPTVTTASYVEVQFTSAQTVDTLAIYAHDLFTYSGTIKVRYYNAGAWTQLGSTLTPTSNGIQLLKLTSTADTRWRIEITSTGTACKIGVAFLGVALVLPNPPVGFSPPFVPGNETESNRSVGGALLGIYGKPKSEPINVDIRYQTLSWIRTYWLPFMRHASRRAFIVSWNKSYLSESWFCWTEKPLKNPEYSEPNFLTANLMCEATDGL